MGGLSLSAADLAKIGQLMLDGGTWQGTRIVSAKWVRQSTTPVTETLSQYGLLWWILPPGQIVPNKPNPPAGFRGHGYLGQNLIVIPQKRLIVIRQISQERHRNASDDFDDIVDLSNKLVTSAH
jgi:CubicO group peptidase (beta-lactamase class C family)